MPTQHFCRKCGKEIPLFHEITHDGWAYHSKCFDVLEAYDITKQPYFKKERK